MPFDSNVWLALTISAHPQHSLAKKTFAAATPSQPALFCRATQQSFLRLATNPAILKVYGAEGLTNQDAASPLESLKQLPEIRALTEPQDLHSLWLRLASLPSTSPKVGIDAYLAAFAILHEMEFVTLDRDFRNFESDGLSWMALV